MIRALYSLATWLAQPLLRRKLRRRGVAEPGYLHAVDERFGRYATARPEIPDGAPLVWIHAVSLGETRAAAILLTALRQQVPGMRLLLTHGTATGRAEGQKLLQRGDVQIWQPWDTRGAVRSFLKHFRPDIGVLMETEIWPNLIHESAAQGVPLALANARLSEKSLRGAVRAGGLLRPAYRALTAAWAQTESDAARLRRIGAPVDGVFGNLKFDAQPDPGQMAQGRAWRQRVGRPVLMLASSREGEEAALLDQIVTDLVLGSIQARAVVDPPSDDGADRASMQWLIVPRHPQRFDAVAALIEDKGLSVSRRSRWGDAPGHDADPDRPVAWLGDSLGEMALYYAMADVALLGASFEPLGGQNLIEAAACGCPLVLGPHTHNFAEAAEQAIAAGAAVRVANMEEGAAAALAIATDPARRAAMADAAQAFAAAHRGAAQRTAEAIAALIGVGPPAG